MATFTELYIEQGASFTANVNLIDSNNGVLNLYSYTANSQFRKSYQSATAYNLDVSVVDSANGEILLSMTSANTANVKAGRYVFDLVVTDALQTKTRVIEGIITVLPSVTR